MDRDGNAIVDISSDLTTEVKNAKDVEELLERTCRKLCETEINIRLFSKMTRNGVATNDVRNFVSNQAMLKTEDHEINGSVAKKAMKSKFVDACAQARRLRFQKCELRDLLVSEFNYSKKRCRTIIKKTIGELSNHRQEHILKAKNKYDHCKSKMKKDKETSDFADIPARAWDLLEGVNLFNREEKIVPEA